MGEEKPTKADKDSRYLNEEEHNTKDDHEVHEVKRLVERCRSNQVMRISLIIQRGPTLDYEAREKYVREEVPARVQQSPHVDIPWRINTLIWIKNGLSIATDEPHWDGGENHASNRMRKWMDIAAIHCLLDRVHLGIDSRNSGCNQMDYQKEGEPIGQWQNR